MATHNSPHSRPIGAREDRKRRDDMLSGAALVSSLRRGNLLKLPPLCAGLYFDLHERWVSSL